MQGVSGTNQDRVVTAYFSDMQDNKQFELAEERRLFKAYRTCAKCAYAYPLDSKDRGCPQCRTPRNLAARNAIVESALKFVVKVAREYVFRTKGIKGNDELLKTLISAGNLGLLVAVDRFDLAHNTKFLTYAAWWIREKILEELDNLGIVRVPAHKQKALRAQRKYGGGTEVEAAHVVLASVSEIDDHTNDDQLERNLVNTYGADLLITALNELALRERDKYIILAYFGAKEESKNLRQISSRLLISAERVRQLKKQALEKLRQYFARSAVTAAHDVFS